MRFAKKLLAVTLVFMLVFSLAPGMVLADNGITVTIDGQAVEFPGGQGPVIVDSRTLVPIRGVFEALGFEVDWDGDTQTAVITNADYELRITINEDVFTVNGVNYTLDVHAQLIGGRTMVPIRLPLEAVGIDLDWDGDTRTVLITVPIPDVMEYPAPDPTPPTDEENATEEDEQVEGDEVENDVEPEIEEEPGTEDDPQDPSLIRTSFGLFSAISAVSQNGVATITMGADFTHPYSLWITGGRNITIDTNGHTLDIVVDGGSQAVMVDAARFTITGGGRINLIANEVHVALDVWNGGIVYVEEGTTLGITNSGYGLDHPGTNGQLRGIRALMGSNVTIRGDIRVDGFSNVGVGQGATGVRSRDSRVTVHGNIAVTGAHSAGIYVSIERSTVTVSGTVTASGQNSQQILRRQGSNMGSPGQDTVTIGG
ncbi:MAG: copper amine oxidase N-terminal domain-containing protein [Defluviitaleaceae bacterium]|nr:copper amine oxidase N-terminal domain-containing protein [Defluviitaleaceae bacterium]